MLVKSYINRQCTPLCILRTKEDTLSLPKQTIVVRRQLSSQFIRCINIHIDLPIYLGCYDVTPEFLSLTDVPIQVAVRSGDLRNSQTFLLTADSVNTYKVVYTLTPTEGVLLLQDGSTPFTECVFELDLCTPLTLSLPLPLPCAVDLDNCALLCGRLDVISSPTDPNTQTFGTINAVNVVAVNTSVGCSV